jgi:hypothetical protein
VQWRTETVIGWRAIGTWGPAGPWRYRASRSWWPIVPPWFWIPLLAPVILFPSHDVASGLVAAAGRCVYVVSVITLLVRTWQSLRLRIDVDPNGATVRNLVSTTRVDWRDLVDVQIDGHRHLHLITRDRVVACRALPTHGGSLGPSSNYGTRIPLRATAAWMREMSAAARASATDASRS